MAIRDHVNAIVAVDIDEESLAKAEERAIVDIVTTDLRSGISNADVIILATPVRTILSTLKELANIDLTRKIVTDLGSTKKEICEAMDNLPSDVLAIGAHPMCGRELSGLAAAKADLFQQKKTVLCRTKRTTDYAQSIISELFEATGTEIIFIDADLHDNLVALTSHMPYLLSGILTRQAAGAAEREGAVWEVAASGFADMSRLAGSNSTVMLDILATNRSSITSRLESYRSEIDQVIQIVNRDNEKELLEWLRNVENDYAEYRQISDQ